MGLPSPPASQLSDQSNIIAQSQRRCNSTRSNEASLPQYQCHICSKRYERQDHLKRHKFSHENTRSHKCPDCPRRFNRKDLLTRHRSVHDPSYELAGKSTRGAERAVHACDVCIKAKTKCNNQRPCRRCRDRAIDCNDNSRTLNIDLPAPPESSTTPHQWQDETDQALNLASDMANESAEVPAPANSGLQQFVPLESVPSDNVDCETWNFNGDLSQLCSDLDFYLDDTLQSIQSDLWQNDPALSVTSRMTRSPQELSMAAQTGLTRNPSVTLVSGYEAFKKSPWLWTPVNQDHAYAENQQLSIDEQQIMASPEMIEDVVSTRTTPAKMLETGTRDEILSMVIKFSKSNLKVRSFPSIKLMSVLMQAFFAKDAASVDSWVHLPSFDPDNCRTELLMGIIAAGATFFAIPNMWKMGLALQEILKLASADALDEDNRLARDLQANQAFFLWIEIGLWSGFRRKMEIGEGFAHSVPTMLRRAGAFHHVRYAHSPIPAVNDHGEVLRQKWLEWVEQESFKRLVLKLYINEMQSCIAFVRPPVFSGTELALPLPMARDLWIARDPDEWKARFLSRSQQRSNLTLVDCMLDPSNIETDAGISDARLSWHAVIYGFTSRVWNFLDSNKFIRHNNRQASRAASVLWLDAQKQELYRDIQSAKEKLSQQRIHLPEAQLVCEVLMMYLHVSAENVQRFAGRYGEEESLRVTPILREWANSTDRYITTWHAGQVLRAARAFPPTQLRGFSAIAVYHACLTLWVSSVLTNQTSLNTEESVRDASQPHLTTAVGPIQLNLGRPNQEQLVILDGEETAEVRAYLKMGRGRPYLKLADTDRFDDLSDLSVILKAMRDVYQQNFPSPSQPLPPLLETLLNLLRDLSTAQPSS